MACVLNERAGCCVYGSNGTGGNKRKDGAGVGDDAQTWHGRAACRNADQDDLFGDGAAQTAAKAVCADCEVRLECLAQALDNRIEHGVWGGMTERERRALLRRRPLVASWRRLLEIARSEHGQRVQERLHTRA
ncbi:WhiB family transcriptional regulator [Streptomyces sp. BR123]|uniref:WhiB family transcriptional regulator n=1 Tax=Streptomyces sp. BR123 TaxID=2749828 RepID=UPI0015C4733C|nr:WhiB family transcriptional regulator [Streptomyces sp. BR123]NXY95449.1 WhiB family transcriptional regulator [Streptomyces sp. BR123]